MYEFNSTLNFSLIRLIKVKNINEQKIIIKKKYKINHVFVDVFFK